MRFVDSHEWARFVDDNTVEVGLSTFAVSKLAVIPSLYQPLAKAVARATPWLKSKA